jgi:nicotinamidase-related amidase
MLYRWRNSADKLKAVGKSTRKMGSGRRPMHPIQEETIYADIMTQRDNGLPLSWSNVCLQMKELVGDSFKASYGWVTGFKKRFNLSLKTPTIRIPSSKWKQRKEKIKEDAITVNRFIDHLNYLESNYSYHSDNIINMDETPTWIDSPIKKTVSPKGQRDVAIKTLDPSNRRRITTILTCTQSGKLLDPCIIELGQSKSARDAPGSTRYKYNGIDCYKQKNNTMTSHIMTDWIGNWLAPQFNPEERKILIMDSCSAHKTTEVKHLLKKHNFDLVMIPGGFTKYLQPLDLTVNRSFKTKLKHRYIDTIKQGEQVTKSTSKSRLTSLFDNVIEAVKDVSSECVKKGFEKMRRRI